MCSALTLFSQLFLGVFSTESLLFEMAEAVSGKQQVASDDLAVSSLEIGQRHLEKEVKRSFHLRPLPGSSFPPKVSF